MWLSFVNVYRNCMNITRLHGIRLTYTSWKRCSEEIVIVSRLSSCCRIPEIKDRYSRSSAMEHATMGAVQTGKLYALHEVVVAMHYMTYPFKFIMSTANRKFIALLETLMFPFWMLIINIVGPYTDQRCVVKQLLIGFIQN